MPDAAPEDRIVLKILSGVQAGAEVSLAAGEYSLGSGVDDDIQIIDVSMKPAHASLRLAASKIEIKKGAGPLRTAGGAQNGEEVDGWQEVQPLDVITAGATRFALGPPMAQWSTITEVASSNHPTAPRRAPSPEPATGLYTRARRLAVPAALLGGVLVIALVFVLFGMGPGEHRPGEKRVSDLAAVRGALDRFAFGRTIAVKQDVDGRIYVDGYVESNVERRAIVKAIGKTNVLVRLRLGVLRVLRSEVAGLIQAEKVHVQFSLSPKGALTLKGVILRPDHLARFLSEVHENVIGVGKIQSRIRTAPTLLKSVEALAHLSQIDESVVFRLDRRIIDANGVISVGKIDQWVGFLQAYSKRFGGQIGLRSYVQLQYAAGAQARQSTPIGANLPILLGANARSGAGTALNIGLLASGHFKMSDVFAGVAEARPAARAAPQIHAPSSGHFKINNALPTIAPPASPNGLRRRVSQARFPKLAKPGASGRSVAIPATPPPRVPLRRRHDLGEMTSQAKMLMAKWTSNLLKKKPSSATRDRVLDLALNKIANDSLGLTTSPHELSEAAKELFANKYLPLFALSRKPDVNSARQCRPGSRLSLDNLPAALFWLDVLSTTDAMTLTHFALDARGFILEAALNPSLVKRCLNRTAATAALIPASIYLSEASRNPAFVRFIVRSLPPYSLDVTGASLVNPRFIQLRNGRKLKEGAAPDAASRIDSVGELGVSILLDGRFSALIYPHDMNWISTR